MTILFQTSPCTSVIHHNGLYIIHPSRSQELNWILCFLFQESRHQPVHAPSLLPVMLPKKPQCFSLLVSKYAVHFPAYVSLLKQSHPKCPLSVVFPLKSCSLVIAIFIYSFLCSSLLQFISWSFFGGH